MEEQEYYTWQEFERDVEEIMRLIKFRGLESAFKDVYGPPKGGLPLAVCMAHRLNIPLILDSTQIGITTLIVDDIADTGQTLFIYSQSGNFIATLFYKRHCSYVPDIWLREKKEKYIHFPWEAEEKEKNPKIFPLIE